MNTFNSALEFLINTIFDLYLFVLVVRMILVWVGANYFDPITQFIVKITDVIVRPTRRLLPTVRGIEIASIVIALLLNIIKFTLISLLSFGMPNLIGIIILSCGDLLQVVLQVFFYAILIQAILSWVQPQSPVNRLLYQITGPIMRPLHRIIPLVGGVDITPIPALIILQLLMMLITSPIMRMGLDMAAS